MEACLEVIRMIEELIFAPSGKLTSVQFILTNGPLIDPLISTFVKLRETLLDT